tara:strand:+ start:18272 stop:21334 length:3063 start_codon:yes stop_codon:yes gene_type:complete
MVQIIAYAQSGSLKYELDVPETPIELNYQFMDLNDPMSRRSPYSFRFQMPVTKGNSKFFSFYYDANVSGGTFDAMKKTECDILHDGVLLMRGSLQMYSVGGSGFEVSVMEQVSQLFDSIKGVTWQQLFITAAGTVDTDLDHALTWTNIRNSWNTSNDITTGAVGNGTIVYPLADGGQGQGVNSQEAGAGLGFYFNGTAGGMQAENLTALNMKPAIRIAYLLNYIFQKAGFTISSTWLNSIDTQNIYMFLALGSVRTQGRATYGFKCGISQDISYPSLMASTWMNSLFTIESVSPFYDPDALVTGGTFIAPYEGTFTLKVNYVITAGGVYVAFQGFTFSIRVTINGASTQQDANQACNYGTQSIVSDERTLALSAGDTVNYYFAATNESGDITVNQTGASSATFLELISFDTSSHFVDVSQNFGEEKVEEWLKAIVQRFNLVMISEPSNPTVIQMEPWSDYWQLGTESKDWTELVDQDSIKIEPTLEFQKKTYEFTDAPGEDFPNKWWQNNFGWIKGKYTFINENDFVSEESKTEEVFQPYRNRALYSNVCNTNTSDVPNVLLPTFWDWKESSTSNCEKMWVSSKPVIAYYNGLQDIGNGGTFNYGGISYSTYPYFAEFNSVGVTETTKSLAWGYDYPDNFDAPFISGATTGGTTQRYAFHEYWSQLFSEIYSQDARVMSCKVNLNYLDIYDLRFNDNLYLDGCFWKVLSIDNFTVGGNSLANVKLIKVVNKPVGRASENCSARVCGFNTDGTVSFCDDVTGAPVSPTETCCTLNGYVWDSEINECFSRNGGDGGGGGGGGGGNGGGGVGDVKPVSDWIQSPNTIKDFPRSSVRTYQQRGVIGTNVKANLQTSTKSNTTGYAKSETGISSWEIPLDTIIYVRVQAVMVETGGTLGVIGNAVTQNTQGTVANTRTSASGKAIARDVGITTVLAKNKDTSTLSTLNITKTQATDGGNATFSVECTGNLNVDAVWFIDMELTTLQIGGQSETMGRQIIYNLDPNEVEYGDLTPDTIMFYNLPLI